MKRKTRNGGEDIMFRKGLITGISLVLGLTLGMTVFRPQPVEATFNICQVLPWLPQCNPNPSPTPSPEPTIEPSVSPEPSIEPCDGECEPEPSVEPSPEVSGCTQKCGWSPEPNKAPEYKEPVCSVSLPQRPSFTFSRVDPITVKMFWNEDDTNTTHWSISYGYSEHDLVYGIPYLPKEAREATITNLEPNAHVWLELARWNSNQCAVYSERLDP